jgi:hypothetical protein
MQIGSLRAEITVGAHVTCGIRDFQAAHDEKGPGIASRAQLIER